MKATMEQWRRSNPLDGFTGVEESPVTACWFHRSTRSARHSCRALRYRSGPMIEAPRKVLTVLPDLSQEARYLSPNAASRAHSISSSTAFARPGMPVSRSQPIIS